MKKMHLVFTLLLTMTAFPSWAQSKKENPGTDGKKLIVGLWQHTSDKLTFNDGSSRTHLQENERVFTLYAGDGRTIHYVSGEDERSYDVVLLLSEGTYSLSKDAKQLTLNKSKSKYGDPATTETVAVKELTADRLVIVTQDEDAVQESTFKKIPQPTF